MLVGLFGNEVFFVPKIAREEELNLSMWVDMRVGSFEMPPPVWPFAAEN